MELKLCPVVEFTGFSSVKIVADSRPGLKWKTLKKRGAAAAIIKGDFREVENSSSLKVLFVNARKWSTYRILDVESFRRRPGLKNKKKNSKRTRFNDLRLAASKTCKAPTHGAHNLDDF